MKSILRITTAACLFVALGLGLIWILSQSGPKLAFAEVADTFLKIRTAKCKMTYKFEGPGPDNPMVKSLKGMKATIMFLAPARQRVESEMRNPATGETTEVVQVYDMAKGKMVQLMPARKTGFVMNWENLPKDRNNMGGFWNVREFLVSASKKNANAIVTSLGSEDIDGKATEGFRLKNELMQMELWADPKTGMPVRIEMSCPAGVMTDQSVDIILSDFETNVDLDESLFSTDVPEGYKLQKMKIDASKPTLADLGKMLRILATRNKNIFPDEIPGPRDLAGMLKKMNEDMKRELSNKHPGGKPDDLEPGEIQEQMDKMMPITRGIQFMASLAPQNDWRYVGKGVKLDAADQPIFWCKLANSDKYQVLYADLSVKELTSDELPPVDPRTP